MSVSRVRVRSYQNWRTVCCRGASGSRAGNIGSNHGTTVDGLPLWKPPYSRITAIDMNTGEHLWWIPVGETPDEYRNHPALEGVEIGDTGKDAGGVERIPAGFEEMVMDPDRFQLKHLAPDIGD